MSTNIKTIKGSFHINTERNSRFKVKHETAEVHITRFWNGTKRGSSIQLSISQRGGNYESSYIHLTQKQCKKLAKVLSECFDYTKYPSE